MNGPRHTAVHNPDRDALMGLAALAVVAGLVGAAWLAVRLAATFDHTARPPSNSLKFIAKLAKGTFHWPAPATAGGSAKG